MDQVTESVERESDGPWELPEGWAWTPLAAIASTRSGNSKLIKGKLHANWKKGLFPAFSASGQDVWVDTPEQTGNAIILSAVGARCGKAFLATGSWAAIANTHIVFPKSEVVYARWLWFRTNDERYWIRSGSAQPFVNVGKTLEKLVALPPIAEQRRIVARVDALFAEIAEGEAALEAARKGLDTFRRALLKAAVTGELTKDWREKNLVTETGHDLLARIKADRAAKGQAKGRGKRSPDAPPLDTAALPELPEGWAWAMPADIQAKAKNALTIGPFGSNLKVNDYRESGVPLIFVRHIRSQNFRGDNPKFVTPEKASELSSHTARAGDVLITKMGDPPGDACRYPADAPDAVITADCIKWRIDDQISFKDFYVHFINSAAGKAQILEKTTGVAQLKVSLDRFRQILVPIPPPAEAAEILRRGSEALAASVDTLAMLDAEAADAARLKQSILKAAFEGRLVPQNPADEPASAMLARLRATQSTARPAKRGRRRRS